MDYVRKLFDTNTFGTMAMVQAVIPQMRARRTGVIVNVTSSVTLAPMPLAAAYTASKWAVRGMTKVAALELADFGIRVNSVHPGLIDTDMVRDTETALPTFKAVRSQLPGPLGAFTSVETCAEALVDNLETRGRRVYVPRTLGVVSALRQLVTGVLAERAHVESGPLGWVASIDLDYAGFVIVGLFVAVWAVALLIWRYGRIEDRWSVR